MGFEELDSLEKLEELMKKLEEAKNTSKQKEKQIEELKEKMLKTPYPAQVEEMKEEIAKLEEQKTEFDEMTENAVVEAKERLIAVRAATEKKMGEELRESANAKRNAENREDAYIRDEEKIKEEMEEKAKKMKARAREKALARVKKLEEDKQLSKDEIDAIIKEEVDKVEQSVARSLEKLQNRTFKAEVEGRYQDLLQTQASLRAKLGGYHDFLEGTVDKLPEERKKPEPLTLIEQYDQLKGVVEQSERRRNQINQEIREIEAQLQADPDNEQLKNDKARLTSEWGKLKAQENSANKKLKELEEQLQGKGQEGQGQEGQGQEGQGQGRQGQGRQGQENGGLPLKVDGPNYYDGLSAYDKYLLKTEAYELTEGEAPKGLLTKLLIFLPNRALSTKAERYLSSGEIKTFEARSGESATQGENNSAKTQQTQQQSQQQSPWHELTKEQQDELNKKAAEFAKANATKAAGQPKRTVEGPEK